jgi:hypothetical protein
MFEIKKFSVDATTGITDFEILFDVGNGPDSDKGSFIHKSDAIRYINSMKRSYIWALYCKYVHHARILQETGHRAFYNVPEKLNALDRCIRYESWFEDKPLEVMCSTILKLESDLRRILPSPGNSSYQSSESRLADIMVFCRQEEKRRSINPIRQTARQA